MRCLMLLIITVLIFIAAVLTVVKYGQHILLFNFSIIPVLIAVFFLSNYEAFILFCVSFVLSLSFLLLGVGLTNVIHPIIFLIVGAASGHYLRDLTGRILNLKVKILEVIKEEHRTSYEFNKKTQDDRLRLEKMVYDISSLYQTPKKMTSSTTLEELLMCLKNSLEGYFTFRSCKLIIFSFKDKKPQIDRIYNIPEKDQKQALVGYEESLVRIMKTRKGPLVIDRGSDMAPPEELKGFLEDINTFVAVPLIVGNRLNGIFAIEEILLDDIIRFIILANQFSMVLERIRLYELVQELAITDGLTGVFVRRYFLERLNEEIERAKYFNTHLSFMMIDIDHFKRCNDKYGHLVGDVALREIANILKRNLREIDCVGRYGGEEFSIILPETAKADATVAGERLCKAVETSRIDAYDEKILLTISIGITTFPDDTAELNQLIDRADQMLYKAKEEGRNRLKVYE